MSIDVTITGGTAPEVKVGDSGASVSVPSVTGVLSLNSLSGAVTLAVVGGTIAAAGNTLTITVTGGGASSWADLTGKPFTTLGTGLVVVSGVLSATGLAIADTTGLQAALDAKAPLASPTFTGTVSGVTKAMVGLSAVDNTADASKPVSTSQAAADAAVQAHAIQRANHTGTQAVGTITGLGSLATLSAIGSITSAGAIGTVAGSILTTDAGGVIGTSAVGVGIVLEGDSIQADVPYIKTQLATVATSGAYADLSGTPTAYALPTATSSILGGIKIGSGLTIDGSGVVTAAGTYTLPNATTSVLGGVIVGTGLSVTSGTISVSYGTSGTTACVGNDSRLSDARTPTAHASTHQTGGADAVASVVVTPTSLTADVNDWAIGTGDFFRVAGTAARNVTGIAAGTSGQAILLINVGSFALTLKHASASSTAANRFTTPWAGDCILAAAGGNAVLVYDSTSSTWRVL